MGKYISLGEYNKLYKYIWIYLIIRFLTTYIFYNRLIFEPIKNDALKFPDHPFITEQIDYIGYIIISIILISIKKCNKKRESNINFAEEELIFNKQDIEIIYGVEQKDYFLFINIFFAVLRDLILAILNKFKISLVDYWVFEMLFYELFHSRIFKTKIYKHHIFSFIFILSSGCLIKSIIIILNFTNDTPDANFFEKRKWLIPLAIIAFLLYRVFITYTFSNIKYYLERRIISIENFVLFYGIFGLITSSICALISSYVPCGDDSIPELSKTVCNFKENNKTYYFDNFNVYFETFSNEYLGLRIFFMILRSIFNYAGIFYVYVIYKKLSPIYYICLHRLNVLILNILHFINNLIYNDIKGINLTLSILDFLILFFYILGSIIYLEFIELKFCNFNFYTRRNIKERSNIDRNLSLGDIDVNSDSSPKEIEE